MQQRQPNACWQCWQLAIWQSHSLSSRSAFAMTISEAPMSATTAIQSVADAGDGEDQERGLERQRERDVRADVAGGRAAQSQRVRNLRRARRPSARCRRSRARRRFRRRPSRCRRRRRRARAHRSRRRRPSRARHDAGAARLTASSFSLGQQTGAHLVDPERRRRARAPAPRDRRSAGRRARCPARAAAGSLRGRRSRVSSATPMIADRRRRWR